jgi:hypothetical protein
MNPTVTFFRKNKRNAAASSACHEELLRITMEITTAGGSNMHVSQASLSTFIKNRRYLSTKLVLKALAGLTLALAFADSSVAQTPTPTCAPGWVSGPPMPPVGAVRAVGAFFSS